MLQKCHKSTRFSLQRVAQSVTLQFIPPELGDADQRGDYANQDSHEYCSPLSTF